MLRFEIALLILCESYRKKVEKAIFCKMSFTLDFYSVK